MALAMSFIQLPCGVRPQSHHQVSKRSTLLPCSVRRGTPTRGGNLGTRTIACRAEAVATGATISVAKHTPHVKIDNVSDPFATVVSVEFGENSTELLDAITALKNMGLNIRRAKLSQNQAGGIVNIFYITDADTSEKVVKSARLEDIRMTVINSLIATIPEAREAMVTGAQSIDAKALGAVRKVVQTTIDVSEASNGSCSVLKIVTRDRPGLLVDIVRVLKDINLNVVSAEVDTVGNVAQDEFFITYHGEPLNAPMVLLVTNALQYYLSLAEVAKEESY